MLRYKNVLLVCRKGIFGDILLIALHAFSILQVFGFTMSLTNVVYLVVSTLISVAVHEFGHAVAAARSALFPLSLFWFKYNSHCERCNVRFDI